MKLKHQSGSQGIFAREGALALVLRKQKIPGISKTCRPGFSPGPHFVSARATCKNWIPAFSGMTLFLKAAKNIRARFQQKQVGFTLIEIMIVIVIVGIALSLAVANLFPDDSERLRQESERTFALLENVRDEAALGGRTIGLQLRDNQLEFLERDPQSPENKWRPLSAALFVVKPFATGVLAELRIGADTIDSANAAANASIDPGNPAYAIAAFQPAGVAAPFTLRLATAQNARLIRSDPLGNLSFASDAAAAP